jgi:hypothetical protein
MAPNDQKNERPQSFEGGHMVANPNGAAPGRAGEQKIARTHVALRNGMGTVSTDEYDERIHGRALEETDDQYRARVEGRFRAIPAPPVYPPTSIPNLQTFTPVDLPTPPAPQPANVVSTARPVITTDDVKDGQIDPEGPKMKQQHEASVKARPGAVAGATAAAPPEQGGRPAEPGKPGGQPVPAPTNLQGPKTA